MITRPARAEDLPAVAALIASVGLPEAGLDALLGAMTLAEEDGSVLGCAAVEEHGAAAYLRALAVARDARCTGLGGRLAEEALARAAGAGAAEAWLMTEMATEFFARRGFAPQPRAEAPPWLRGHEHFRSRCAASASVMRRAPASPSRLFVYGTLRRGGAAAMARTLAATGVWLGPAQMAGCLHDLGDFPAATDPQSPTDFFDGEVFALPAAPAARAALLAALDHYERSSPAGASGLPFARRHRRARLAEGGAVDCAIYLWQGPPPPGPRVARWPRNG